MFLRQKKFRDWQPWEISAWFNTLPLTEDYSFRIMQHKITGEGLIALIEANEMESVGFDVITDNTLIKGAVRSQR